MIYVENDFYSNFSSVAKSNDDVSMRSILVDQISNVIAKHRAELIELFGKVGIKVSPKPTNKELSDLVVSSIKTNKKFVVGLSYLIAKDNDLLQSEEKKERPTDTFSGVDDKKDKPKKSIDWNKGADAVTTIAGSISTFADTLTGIKSTDLSSDINAQLNQKSPEQIEQENKAQADADAKRKRNRRIFLGVLAVLVVGGGIWAYKKGYFNKQA